MIRRPRLRGGPEPESKITVGELAVITVTPVATPRHEKRQSLGADRAALLQALGAGSVADTHELLAKRRELEATRKGVLAELRTLKVAELQPIVNAPGMAHAVVTPVADKDFARHGRIMAWPPQWRDLIPLRKLR
jgi:hypothetical protein